MVWMTRMIFQSFSRVAFTAAKKLHYRPQGGSFYVYRCLNHSLECPCYILCRVKKWKERRGTFKYWSYLWHRTYELYIQYNTHWTWSLIFAGDRCFIPCPLLFFHLNNSVPYFFRLPLAARIQVLTVHTANHPWNGCFLCPKRHPYRDASVCTKAWHVLWHNGFFKGHSILHASKVIPEPKQVRVHAHKYKHAHTRAHKHARTHTRTAYRYISHCRPQIRRLSYIATSPYESTRWHSSDDIRHPENGIRVPCHHILRNARCYPKETSSHIL